MERQMETQSERLMIHADNRDCESGTHPKWQGSEGRELSSCPFTDAEFDENRGMTEINSRLERVLDKAPSDSSANLLVRRTRDGRFKAFLRIRSANQRFAGFIRGSRLIDVVEHVLKDVRSQIEAWKSKRQLADDSF